MIPWTSWTGVQHQAGIGNCEKSKKKKFKNYKKNEKLARILKVAENHKSCRKVAEQLLAKLTYHQSCCARGQI